MTVLEAYEAFDRAFPMSMAWFDFDNAPQIVQLDGDFTLAELKEIIRLAEAVEREL